MNGYAITVREFHGQYLWRVDDAAALRAPPVCDGVADTPGDAFAAALRAIPAHRKESGE